MVHYYIYAKDFSGWTYGIKDFHTKGLKTLEEFHNDIENIEKELLVDGEPKIESKIIYLHCGGVCYEVDKDTIITSYNDLQSGFMNTQLETIIEWLKQYHDVRNENNKIKLLYFITDAMIEHGSTEKCFEMNKDINFGKVVFHALNLSVAESFFKTESVYRSYEYFHNIDVSKAFDYDKITVSNFGDERKNLKEYIKLKFINRSKHDVVALQEIENLKKFQDRLFAAVNLETKDRNVFLREFVNTDWYKGLLASSCCVEVDIEKCISTLINYIVSDQKSFSLDALQFDKPVEEESIVEEEPHFAAEQAIEFHDVILYDEKGIPVILLTEFNLLDKFIFHNTEESSDVSASFNKFMSVMECPLILLNDPDVNESIGYFYTLNVYKQLLSNSTKTEPRTGRPYHGGLVLTDTDAFDKYNDYILSATYFNFKKVNYNIGLFYYVLWKKCESKEWMDKNVVERFKAYVLRRISTTVCRIGLSSLPLDPQINTSLPTALWYCVELSSCIFKDDAKYFTHERLRMYYGVAHHMIEILKYLNYDLDLKFIENRLDIIKHVMILQTMPTRAEKCYYLLERIFKNVNGFLISKIEKPYNMNKLNYLKLDHQGLLRDDIIKEKIQLSEYVHLMHYVGDMNGKAAFKICEKTFRPFFTINQNKSFYTELVKITKKIVINNNNNKIKVTYKPIDSLGFDRILSYCNLFIKCVLVTNKYPTLPEYLEYISKKKKFNGDLVTIFPPNIMKDARDIYSRYLNIMVTVDVNKFIEVTNRYVKRVDRIKAEEIYKFKDESKINEFISREEIKSGIKKNVNKPVFRSSLISHIGNFVSSIFKAGSNFQILILFISVFLLLILSGHFRTILNQYYEFPYD